MESATNGHYNFSRADLPLRVIHVGDTLANEHGGICLMKPTNWDFHVLSHTWSQLIRDLSKEIGQLLMKKRSSNHELNVETAYNQAFLKENFKGNQAYEDLVELLRLLREERVESIWFDALCIDQTNDKEKELEISRMAAYYANSKGCYVLMHGVGQGYRLWRPDSPKEIPRWFERVWTLQEFILPRSLTFMVEALDHRVVSVVNQLIAKHSPSYAPSIGLCCCCIPSDLLEKRPSSISAMCHQLSAVDIDVATDPYNIDITQCRNKRDVCCSICRSKVLLRSTSKPSTAPLELLHFVDREAFLLVARAALLMDTHGRWIKNWGYEQMLCSMYKLIERKPNPRQVMSRIGERYCSVPEDRVLSILGVLGVQQEGGGGRGAEQLRTGQTLDYQILKAVNLCDQDTIIELCATDAVGYCIQGMSWSPNFRDNWDRYRQGWMSAERASIALDQSWTSDIQWIRRKVEVLRPITASGMRLRCRLAEAHITPYGAHHCTTLRVGDSFTRLLTMSQWQHCLHSDDNRNPRPQVVNRVQQKNFKGIYMKDFMPSSTVYHGNSTQIYVTVASEMIPEDADGQELEVLGEFKVWLVQLGSVESGVELIMVCLGSSDHAGGELQLHKVGMLALESKEASQIFTQESSECVLGGFGQDLSKYLNIITTTSASSTTTHSMIQATGAAAAAASHRCSSSSSSASCPNQIMISMMPLVHIPLSPIFEWTTAFVKISYPHAAGEAVAYNSGSDPIIFPYGRTIQLNLEAPHIKQLLHRYLMDAGSLPSGCPVRFALNGMSTIQFSFSPNRNIRDGV